MTTDIERLVMRMAENRAEHRAIASAIADLHKDGYIDLHKIHEYWYGDGCEGLVGWPGWVVAVEHYEDGYRPDEEPLVREMELAKLLDKRAELRQELGKIRRALCAKGRALLRAA